MVMGCGFFGTYEAMRELEVACSVGTSPQTGASTLPVETLGRPMPRTDPGYGSMESPKEGVVPVR